MSIEKQIASLMHAGELQIDAPELALRCLTLDGKVIESDARRALSSYEQTVFDYLRSPGWSTESEGQEIVLAFRSHGRCYLLPSDFADQNAKYLSFVRRFYIPTEIHLQAMSAKFVERDRLNNRREQIVAYLSQEGFAASVEMIGTKANHMAPLIFYVGSLCISNFYQIGKAGFPNEVELQSALEEVAQKGAGAEIEALTFVYCLKLLFASGSHVRPEEMNSSQLSCESLEQHFRDRLAHYQSILSLKEDELNVYHLAALHEKADLLAKYRSQASNYGRFIRDINGLILLKKERFIRHWALGEKTRRLTQEAMSFALIEHAIDGCMPAAELFSERTFPALLRRGVFPQKKHDFLSDIEFLIEALVRNAIEATNSDVGMTRGIRSFGLFAELLDKQDTGTACSWTQAEYFCHAAPSVNLENTHHRKTLAKLLNAVSARMRYNSWHYAPSYFPESNIPATRGWFTAPSMPDTTEWSDHHHAGHVHAAVRYSIRSPHPISVREKVLPGFIDLRLMRQQGQPYTESDLGTAIVYTEALGLVYQRLMDYVLATGNEFSFRFGDKLWFDRHYASEEATV